MHKGKIRGVRKAIDNETPSACKYPIINSKKLLNDEGKLQNYKFIMVYTERCTEIERENRILLSKMTDILSAHKSITDVRGH